MDKDAQTDLFPWILGILLIAVAVPAVLAFTKPAAQPVPSTAAGVTATLVTPAEPRSALPAPMPMPTPAATPPEPTAPARVQQATRPALPAGQVWQCVVNGQKVFSDAACGDGATIRQLSDVNGMQPTPVARAPTYPGYSPYPGIGPYPGYGPNPGNAPPPGYYSGPQDQDPGSASDVYAANQVALIDGRRQHEHLHPERPHNHAAARGHF